MSLRQQVSTDIVCRHKECKACYHLKRMRELHILPPSTLLEIVDTPADPSGMIGFLRTVYGFPVYPFALSVSEICLCHLWPRETHGLTTLHQNGVAWLPDLLSKSPEEVKGLLGFGPIGWDKVLLILKKLGVELKGERGSLFS